MSVSVAGVVGPGYSSSMGVLGLVSLSVDEEEEEEEEVDDSSLLM